MHIGLFDSGVGGLTVLRELQQNFPDCDFTYLGDTARLPYGNKSPKTLRRYTDQNIEFLEGQGVDVIVIACHSASTIALEQSTSPKGLPIFNVISPSSQAAVQQTRNGHIALLATKSTVNSKVYSSYFNSLDKTPHFISQACPLLVPLVEENLIDDPITQLALQRYLTPVQEHQADVIILGCTHYPILREPIAKICGPDVTLIDPAHAVAQAIEDKVSNKKGKAQLNVFLTDHSPHFLEHAQRLLKNLPKISFLRPESH